MIVLPLVLLHVITGDIILLQETTTGKKYFIGSRTWSELRLFLVLVVCATSYIIIRIHFRQRGGYSDKIKKMQARLSFS
ncbi:hypothetical protein GCK32_021067, partial [Trichostrongylus colubriformis]